MKNGLVLQILKENDILNENLSFRKKFKKQLLENPAIVQIILNNTQFLKYDADLKVRICCIIKNITYQPTCKICNNILKMRMDGRYRNTFPTFCGAKCFAKDDEMIEKRKKTCVEKYGVENPLGAKEIIEKRKKTCVEKYGVENPRQNNEIGERTVNTYKERYGNPEQQEKIKEKRKKTCIEKYGSIENTNRIMLDKMKKTCIEKYGADNVFKLKEFQQIAKKQMKETYGYEHALQVPELRDKFNTTMKETYGYEHALQVPELRDKFNTTMKETYGYEHALQDSNLLNQSIQNTLITNLKKYGVSNSLKLNYNDGVLEKLENKNWLYNEHHNNKKTLTKIAEDLNVTHSTIGRYFNIHNIKVLTISGSQGERELNDFLSEMNLNTVTNSKKIIPPYEIDVFLPKHNIALEYNGTYWHGELNNKSRNYHIEKTNNCEAVGVRLIHIQEDEWILKEDICKSRIRNILGKSEKIYGRNTKIVNVNKKEAKEFLNNNHIQGWVNSNINYGLMYNGELVALMTFDKSRYNKKYQYELIRYSNKLNTSVVGGASKLFKHFIKEHNPTSIISYSDKRWNTGKLYENLNFSFSHSSAPNYRYFKQSNSLILYSRHTFQKHKLKNKLEIFDPKLTEWQNMVNNGYDRIWDCGNDVFIWNA